MRIILFGKNGQLGWELLRTLAPLGEVLALDYPEIDLAHPQSACQRLQEFQPEIVINATAYTQVDRAESEPELAMAINGIAPGELARAAAQVGAAFIHYSTDYVFDGKKGSPYIESDSPNPINMYGKSKLAGEQAVEQTGGAYLILRTSWVYSLRRESFVTKVLSWARQQQTLRIVADQIGSPTWARMLAEVSALLLAKADRSPAAYLAKRSGIYHLAGNGCASRFEWAQAILENHQQPGKIANIIEKAKTEEYPTPAQRPGVTCLSCDLFLDTFKISLPDWKIALKMAMENGCI